ncbi:MAG: hypothetical protein N2254_02240 [bacterium]|nr:hypothetical protein [bacterium]
MVLLYGATGFIGKSVSEKLSKLCDLIISGRDIQKLEIVSRRIYEKTKIKPLILQMDINEIHKFDLHKLGVKKIINLAYLPPNLLERFVLYSINNQIDYLDISADTKSVIEIWRKYNPLAEEKKVLIIQPGGIETTTSETIISDLKSSISKRAYILYESIFYMVPKSLKSLLYLISSSPTYTSLLNIYWDGREWIYTEAKIEKILNQSYLSIHTIDVATIPRLFADKSFELRSYLRIPKIMKDLTPFLIHINGTPIRNYVSKIVRKFMYSVDPQERKKDRLIIKLLLQEDTKSQRLITWEIENPILLNEELILFYTQEMLKGEHMFGILPPTVAFPKAKQKIYEKIIRQEIYNIR